MTCARSASAALLVLLVAGCAHVAPRPPRAEEAPRRAAPGGAPPAAASPQSPRAGAPGAPGTPDPSEVMTPAELATIPDPVPDAGSAPRAAPAAPKARAAPGSQAAPDSAPAPEAAGRAPDGQAPADHSSSSPGEALEGSSGARAAGNAVWRVQIFASPDRKLADQQAMEASTRLGVPASVVYEGRLYKVRLGAFGSDDEAQALRERAVRQGWPGAFRVRTSKATNDDSK